MKQLRSFFLNGCILTATSLLMRSVAMLFRVYLSERLGPAGLGLFTLIMSVYGFCVTLATSGIHLAAVRLTCHALAQENEQELQGALRRCLCYCLSFGCGAGILLFFSAPYIAQNWLCDLRTVRAMRVLALGLPCLSISSCIGGYFHAVRRVVRSAAVQVMEQGSYMVLCVCFFSVFGTESIENACLAVICANVLSDLMGACVNAALLFYDRHRHRLPPGRLPEHQTKELLSIALPVAVSVYARSALLTLEHLLIPRGLRAYQSNAESALASYGILHGMALPAVLFFQAFLGAFAGLLVAELSESQGRGDDTRIRRIFWRAFSLTLPFCCLVSALLYCFAPQIGEGIYHQAQATQYIRWLAPLIVVMYLDTVTDAMLKGLGEQNFSMRVNIADAALSVIGVWLLLPRYGLLGYFIVIYFCEIFNTVCSVGRLLWKLHTHAILLRCALPSLFAALGTVALWRLFTFFSQTVPQSFLLSLPSMMAFVGIYLLLLCGLHNGKLPKTKRVYRILFAS